ncbi:unnamed protein product [Periconia digitata]|uniref:Uncharacterized protein n=1 Tax=Periconia digitata TaxID=1303443 RepID=A0A9W4U9B6_9PLEO|nr:unnamed protein product [Periconia digitata]
MAENTQPSVHQLAERLADGFAALSGEYQTLFEQQRQLESKLSWAKQQYLDLLKRFTPDTLAQDHRVFLQDLAQFAPKPDRLGAHWTEHLDKRDDTESKQHYELIKKAEQASAQLSVLSADTGVKIWSGPLADKEPSVAQIRSSVDASQLEKDFTTVGTPSKLGCPFASTSTRQSPLATPRSSTSRLSLKGRRSKRPSFNDPIRAEICGADLLSASATPSVEGSGAVCPIRFLDQHAPEEVAKYFEKHKHELPRSHEVCIGRFQSNAESIEQLDRKYGNLVSMIQGLGEKHQAWLPEEPEDMEDAPEDAAKQDAKVEKWATAVTSSLQDSALGPGQELAQSPDETRTAHFDRPMKEVRVGESPSRPWGISIPPKYTNAGSSSSVGSAPTASPQLPLETSPPVEESPKRPGKCPFGDLVKNDGSKVKEVGLAPEVHQEINTEAPVSTLEQPVKPGPEPAREKPSPSATPQVVPQMVFNGPVFFGYPPEQLAILLQNSNLGGVNH